ncbi:MAG: ABC transporter permease [Bacillota bacterium]
MVKERCRVYSVVSVGVVVLAWHLVSTFVLHPFFLPSPLSVIKGAIELTGKGTLLPFIGISLVRIFSGWVLGSLVAVPIGLLVGWSRTVRSVVDPFIHFLRFIPAISLVTLFIVWFGVGETSKILLIAYATGFIIMVNTATGVGAIPDEKINAARCLGANGRSLFLHVIVPATLPHVYVGMRLAMASSFLVIVGAEMLAANSGVGYLIWTSRLWFRTDWVFTGIVILGLLGRTADRAWRLVGATLMAKYVRQVARY